MLPQCLALRQNHILTHSLTPSLSLDSSRSKYRRVIEYVLALFLQAAGAPPATPPRHALFESFFASAFPSPQSLSFNWLGRVHTALVVANARMAAFLTAGRSDRSFLPPRHTSYTVRGEHASGKAAPVNKSLISHFDRQLSHNLSVGLSLWDAMALKSSSHVQSEALSYSMWVLSGLLSFVRLQGFSPADPSLFNQLVTTLSKSLAHQASVTTAHTAYNCHKRHKFYLSHLPAYFCDVNKCSMLESPVVFSDSLFRESDVARFLDATSLSSSFRSQQALVDVASRDPSSSFSRQRCYSPHCSLTRSSPTCRRRRESGFPSRPQKKVRFDSPAPSSALKSPRKSHFRD